MSGYFFSGTKGPNGEVILNQNLQEVLTREYFLKAFGEIKGRKMLDIGCAVGDYMGVMAEMGGILSGIDLNAKEIERGRAILSDVGLNVDFHLGNACLLPFEDETFDIVYSADVFEHIMLSTKQAAVKEIYRVLKPGGRVVIKTPNLDYLRISINLRRLKNLLRLKSPRIYIDHTRNNPDNEHCGLTTYRELDQIFADHLFMESEITHLPLRRGQLFISSKWRFPFRKHFNEHIVVAYQKSTFIPISQRLSMRTKLHADT